MPITSSTARRNAGAVGEDDLAGRRRQQVMRGRCEDDHAVEIGKPVWVSSRKWRGRYRGGASAEQRMP